MHLFMTPHRPSFSRRSLGIALLALAAACSGDSPTTQPPPEPAPDAGISGVSNPGSAVCARNDAGTTWCVKTNDAGSFRITQAETAESSGTGPLPTSGVFAVYNTACERAGKAVDRGGAQRNGGAWLDVRCHPDGCVAAPAGLLAYYPFDDPIADSAADLASAASGSALRLHGTTADSGVAMGGLRFNGSAWAEGGAGKDVGTGDFSISLWLRVAPADRYDIISVLDKRDASPIRGYHVALYFGEPLVQLADAGIFDGWYNYHSGIDPDRVADGAWHHLTVTVARAAHDGVRWYLDGVPAGQVADPTGRPGSLSSSSPLVLGRRSFSQDGWLRGSLDELLIMNRALAPAEVLDLHARHVCR